MINLAGATRRTSLVKGQVQSVCACVVFRKIIILQRTFQAYTVEKKMYCERCSSLGGMLTSSTAYHRSLPQSCGEKLPFSSGLQSFNIRADGSKSFYEAQEHIPRETSDPARLHHCVMQRNGRTQLRNYLLVVAPTVCEYNTFQCSFVQ